MKKIERVESQEKRFGSILKQMAEMMKTRMGQGMLSVSIPEALMPQFQLLLKLAQLTKQDLDVP